MVPGGDGGQLRKLILGKEAAGVAQDGRVDRSRTTHPFHEGKSGLFLTGEQGACLVVPGALVELPADFSATAVMMAALDAPLAPTEIGRQIARQEMEALVERPRNSPEATQSKISAHGRVRGPEPGTTLDRCVSQQPGQTPDEFPGQPHGRSRSQSEAYKASYRKALRSSVSWSLLATKGKPREIARRPTASSAPLDLA